jgi:hypothetical protein
MLDSVEEAERIYHALMDGGEHRFRGLDPAKLFTEPDYDGFPTALAPACGVRAGTGDYGGVALPSTEGPGHRAPTAASAPAKAALLRPRPDR